MNMKRKRCCLFRLLMIFLLLSLCSCEIVLGDRTNTAESAYDIAVRHGFEGTEEEWLESLKSSSCEHSSDNDEPSPGDIADPLPAVGIAAANVDERGHLILLMTDGTTIDAGLVRGQADNSDGEQTEDIVDADGFRSVMQTVYAISPVNVRTKPSTASDSSVVGQLSDRETVTRVGINETLGWSRILYGGRICYVSSRYLELTVSDIVVDYGSQTPVVNLMDSYTITAGEPFTLYLDGFTLGVAENMYPSFHYYGSSGAQVQITPDDYTITEPLAGTYSLEFRIMVMQNGEMVPIYGKTIDIIAVDKSEDMKLTGMVLGDSRISDGTILSALKTALGSHLTLIGTKTAAGCNSEGRGGWSTSNYLNYASVSGTVNPFYNSVQQKDSETGINHHFDFSYYMETTGAQAPDFVVIHLGANDTYTAASVDNIKVMVNSIQAYGESVGKDIAVLIMTEYLYPSENYSVSYSVDVPKMRYAQSNYFDYLQAAFANREDENIYLLPNYIVICGTEDRVSKSIVSGTQTMQVVYDLAHLGTSGYKKEAAVILSYLYRIFG